MCRFHQIHGQVGEGTDTRSGGEFQREIPRERRYREGTSEPRRKKKSTTQDTFVNAVENEEVAKIKRAVLRKMTRSRTATIKEFNTKESNKRRREPRSKRILRRRKRRTLN